MRAKQTFSPPSWEGGWGDGGIALIGPVNPELGGATPGGVATHLVHLASGLAARHAALALLATNAPATSPDAWRRLDGGLPRYLHYRPATAAGWLDPAYVRAVGADALARYALDLARRPDPRLGPRRDALGHLLWYRRFLRTVHPRLVHVQHPMERVLYARRAMRLEGIRVPLVVTVHSFYGEHADAMVEQVMAPNLREADALIAVSQSTADQAVALGADRARLKVIRSGVDTDRFRPRPRAEARARLYLPADLPLVLFVGNLEPRKAVDKLLLALREVRQTVPTAQLAILGSGASAGAENQEPRLRAMVRDLGLADAVRFEGRVPDAALFDWYAAADVFALPSSSEAQGIVALEAMASGLPVVASAVGGLLDTIDDGVTGYLVPFGDVNGLAHRLTTLLGDPALGLRLGTAARAAVEASFSWERSVQATIDLYQAVLATWNQRPT